MKVDQQDARPGGHADDAGGPADDTGGYADDAGRAAPSPGRRRRFSPRIAIMAVVAVTVLGLSAGTVYASPDEDEPTTGAAGPSVSVDGMDDGRECSLKIRPGEVDVRPGGVRLTRALHGEFVFAADEGTETRLMQTGEVTALTDTSITVVSSDDFAETYAVEESTSVDHGQQALGDLATGDTVTVLAVVSGDKATAMFIDDRATTDCPPGGPSGPDKHWSGPPAPWPGADESGFPFVD